MEKTERLPCCSGNDLLRNWGKCKAVWNQNAFGSWHSGQVTMAVEDALTDQDKAEGYMLDCQAKIQGDIDVDA